MPSSRLWLRRCRSQVQAVSQAQMSPPWSLSATPHPQTLTTTSQAAGPSSAGSARSPGTRGSPAAKPATSPMNPDRRSPKFRQSKRGGTDVASSCVQVESRLPMEEEKACPRCRTAIMKIEDGACNHMVCSVCGQEFCWLCLGPAGYTHFMNPTGSLIILGEGSKGRLGPANSSPETRRR